MGATSSSHDGHGEGQTVKTSEEKSLVIPNRAVGLSEEGLTKFLKVQTEATKRERREGELQRQRDRRSKKIKIKSKGV